MGQRNDGTIFPVEVVIGEVRIDQELLYIATCRDISQRQETPETIQQVERGVPTREITDLSKRLKVENLR